MKLHHCAYKITPGSSSIIQEFCGVVGGKLVWEGFDQGREIAMEFDDNFRIQFSEKSEQPRDSVFKHESHIGFISTNPVKDMERISEWFSKKQVAIRRGQWSERELWLDCPKIFIDFVIEVFSPKISTG